MQRPLRALTLIFLAVFAVCLTSTRTSAAVHPTVLEAQAARARVVETVSRSTAAVFDRKGTGSGSGVVISSDGFVLTNFHVVQQLGVWMQCGLNDGKLYDAVLVGVDPVGDVALLKLFGRDDFPAAKLGDSDAVRAGDWVYVVGNPFLLADDFHPTVTYGIVSGVHRYQYPAGTLLEYADCIQTDAAINPGNSGGPMFDAAGNLIGVNGRGSFEKRGRVNVGVGYAISINQIKKFLGGLKVGRIMDHANANFVVADQTSGGYPSVTDILPESDAYRRGLRFDDEIIQFGDRQIRSANEFKNVQGIYPAGWQAPMIARRDGDDLMLLIRLDGIHPPGELNEVVFGRSMPSQRQQDSDSSLDVNQLLLDGAPAEIKEHYQFRSGFANYHFNGVAQDNLWRRHRAFADYSSFEGAWLIRGSGDDQGPFEIALGDEGAEASFPSGQIAIQLGGSEELSLDLPRSGGLLTALSLWRRFQIGGPNGFSQSEHLGEMPLHSHAVQAEVLELLHEDLALRYSFAPDDGRLLAAELISSRDEDRGEVRFFDYRDVSGVSFPHRWEIVLGDEAYDVWRIDTALLGASNGTDGASREAD